MSPPLSFGDGCVTGWAEGGQRRGCDGCVAIFASVPNPCGGEFIREKSFSQQSCFDPVGQSRKNSHTEDFRPADFLMCLNGLRAGFPVLSSLPARMAGSVHEGSS